MPKRSSASRLALSVTAAAAGLIACCLTHVPTQAQAQPHAQTPAPAQAEAQPPGQSATGPQAGQALLVPWSQPGAEVRQIALVSAPVERLSPVVTLTLTPPAQGRLRVVLEKQPATPLPYYLDELGRVVVQVPGRVAPGAPAVLGAYWSRARGWAASARLKEPPRDGDDYATVAHSDAWDFDEGDQEGISHWGDRPSQYGKVEVREGHLIVPVKGPDPYFIWGTMFGPPGAKSSESIDSRLYRYLRMRVRQSYPVTDWTVYVTDEKGRYKGHEFRVRGKDWQVVTIDLARAFEKFWDGRKMRALRIDTTNYAPGALVEIDWVRLERPAAEARIGPALTRAQVEARAQVRHVQAALPRQARAGERPVVKAAGLDAQGRPVPGLALALGLREEGRLTSSFVAAAGEDGWARYEVAVGTKAGRREEVVGVADDLGQPCAPVHVARLDVLPARLDHYELTTARRLVLVSQPRVEVTIWGADRFGNRRPVDIEKPRWRVSHGGRVLQRGPLRGAPARVTILCSTTPLTRHEARLWDEARREGRLELRTMELKDKSFTLSSTGYLLDPAGKLYLPLGGFYANWPSTLPDEKGGIGRALDLFPCGPQPYRAGFPWSAKVEKQVRDYLELCHRHGVTGLRLMLRNMDLVGRADPVQLKAVLHLLDLARPLGLRFDVVLFDDYDKPPYVNRAVLEKVILPHYSAEELEEVSGARARFLVDKRLLGSKKEKYTDPDAIACEKAYLDDLLPHLAPREEVFCYELENEMVYPPMSWVNEMTEYLHKLDPKTPVLGNPGPHAWPEPARWRGSKVDLFSYHPYNDGQPDADHGAVAYMRSKWAAAAGKPMFTGEGGINQNRWQRDVKKVPPEYAARGIRDQIWLSMACGACGAFMWTAAHEAEMAEFAKVWPALKAVGIDLVRLKRRRPTVAVVMPEDANANGKACALAWRLLSRGVDFDVVGPGGGGQYATRIDAASQDPAKLGLHSELLTPSEGYQAAYLAGADLGQVLVYLRNVAGGIKNLGDGRACFVRQPGACRAQLRLARGVGFSRVQAYDLDAGKAVAVTVSQDGQVLVAGNTEHDYVLGLRK
ncbi:MAG: hypothetical protein J7M26_09275 [Armatimonadetes bacterium]|nr:hypothetical protein [Armatimonadota bacterium]